jgi:hypothetical protein
MSEMDDYLGYVVAIFCVFFFIVGAAVGIATERNFQTNKWQKKCIENNVGEYNKQTGKFKFIKIKGEKDGNDIKD